MNLAECQGIAILQRVAVIIWRKGLSIYHAAIGGAHVIDGEPMLVQGETEVSAGDAGIIQDYIGHAGVTPENDPAFLRHLCKRNALLPWLTVWQQPENPELRCNWCRRIKLDSHLCIVLSFF